MMQKMQALRWQALATLAMTMGAGWMAAHAQLAPPAPPTPATPAVPMSDVLPQAKEDAPEAKGAVPQAGAERECLASFERDNVIKPEAGPFRVRVDSRLQVAERMLQDSHVVEMTPPDGFRSRSVVNGQASQTVSLGTRTWVQVQGKWHPFPDMAPGATRELYHRYVDAGGLRGLVCLPPSEWEGRAVRSYRFESPQGPGMARTLARFDAATGLPLISDTQATAHPSTTRRFEFDRSIRIEAPQLD